MLKPVLILYPRADLRHRPHIDDDFRQQLSSDFLILLDFYPQSRRKWLILRDLVSERDFYR
jgi:hypothetical protein